MLNITVIGAGRMGTMFSRVSDIEPNIQLTLLRRGQTKILESGPIVVCTRNDDLDGVLEFIPTDRWSDLIFIQNGMLQAWFQKHNIVNPTQALVYVAVSTKGEMPSDGERTVVTGPQAENFKWIMQTLGLVCRLVSKEQFTNEMVEKYLWNCVFGLLCQVHGCSVGLLVKERRLEIDNFTMELLTICQKQLQFQLSSTQTSELIDRLCLYSTSIYDYKGAVKEWSWRNGWLIKSGEPQFLHKNYLEKSVPNWQTLEN